MKNLKKISKQELKNIQGGSAPEWCVGPGGCWDPIKKDVIQRENALNTILKKILFLHCTQNT
ncbi:bacteriocin [Chryseobacterium capnotolerans]|uniref:bacteriocin-like protein n=1 Tax=Chryseobacterium capnotolerans TaxID=2759528 RepID=UPI001E48489E|nr:bacteriocin [Chryseobacterium capnotolerans]UHO38922.1 bacteriocin [Chryseobacterium capnotolerans]